MRDIDAESDMLVLQAIHTTSQYMKAAVTEINELFGGKYAFGHPELVAEFMRTAAIDYQTAMLKVCAQDIRDALPGRTCD
jgi:hypothetical protein